MADDSLHYCSICNRPAYSVYSFVVHSKIDGDQELFDIGCSSCGEYRISADSEAAMSRQLNTHRDGLLRLIRAANARDCRYCANNGREIPLSSIATPPGVLRVPITPPFRRPEQRLGE